MTRAHLETDFPKKVALLLIRLGDDARANARPFRLVRYTTSPVSGILVRQYDDEVREDERYDPGAEVCPVCAEANRRDRKRGESQLCWAGDAQTAMMAVGMPISEDWTEAVIDAADNADSPRRAALLRYLGVRDTTIYRWNEEAP